MPSLCRHASLSVKPKCGVRQRAAEAATSISGLKCKGSIGEHACKDDKSRTGVWAQLPESTGLICYVGTIACRLRLTDFPKRQNDLHATPALLHLAFMAHSAAMSASRVHDSHWHRSPAKKLGSLPDRATLNMAVCTIHTVLGTCCTRN